MSHPKCDDCELYARLFSRVYMGGGKVVAKYLCEHCFNRAFEGSLKRQIPCTVVIESLDEVPKDAPLPY